MPTFIDLPNGDEVEVPDDASPEQLARLRVKLGGMQQRDESKARLEQIKSRAAAAGRRLASHGGEVQSTLRTEALGLTSGLFGVGDRIAREHLKKQLPDATKEELDAGQRAFMRAAFEARPLAFGTGVAAGSFGGAGLAVKGAARGLSKVAPNIGRLLSAQSGQAASNIAKATAAGAASSAVTPAIGEERAPSSTELVFGTLLGAGVPTVAGTSRILARPVTSSISPDAAAATAAMQAVTHNRRVTPSEAVAALTEDVRTQAARAPGAAGIIEHLPIEEAAIVGERIGRRGDFTAAHLREAAERQAAQRAARLRPQLVGDKPAQSVARIRAAAENDMTRAMRAADPHGRPGKSLGTRPVQIPNSLVLQIASDRRALEMLPSSARGRVMRSVKFDRASRSLQVISPVIVPLQALDEARRNAARASNRTTESGQFARELSEEFRHIAGINSPAYEAALHRMASQEALADALEAGRNAASGSADEVAGEIEVRRLNAAALTNTRDRKRAEFALRGFIEGVRQQLAENAGSPEGSLRFVKDASSDALTRRMLSGLTSPAQSLEIAGRSGEELRRAHAIDTAARAAATGERRAAIIGDTAKQGANAAVLVSQQGSAGFRAQIALAFMKQFDLSASAAERMAQRASDPNQAGRFLADMRKAGVSEEMILDIYRRAAVAAGIAGTQVPHELQSFDVATEPSPFE